MNIALPLDAFLNALPDALRESFRAEGEALAETLARLVQDGEAAHPDVRVPPETFLRYLAARLSADDPASARRDLETLAAADLYLACACVQGNPKAASILEGRLRRRAQEALRRLNLPREKQEEITQNLMERMLVAHDGEPRIANYAGKGELEAWFQVAVVRTAQRHLQKDAREVPVEDELLALEGGAGDDLELEFLKRQCRQHFKAAFQEAVTGLAPRERNLLRYAILDGLSIDQIGALNGVHRSTAARQLSRVKQLLSDRTRECLARRIGSSPSEARSLLRIVQSQLEVSVCRFLAGRPEDPEP